MCLRTGRLACSIHSAGVCKVSETATAPSANHTMASTDPLTAAELLRRRVKKTDDDTKLALPEDKPDLDEEIRRLEAELAADDDDSSSDSSSSRSDDDDLSDDGDEKRPASPQVLCLSVVKDDRIEALPNKLLPSNKKRTLKNVDGETAPKKRKERKPEIEPGLKKAVQEVLDGYVARSAERLPFYCRVCAKQYSNEEQFFAHKETDFHAAAIEMERKASYCKLCRKQLTSPAQLKEHLSSRPHEERLQHVQARREGRGGRGRGRDGGRKSVRKDSRDRVSGRGLADSGFRVGRPGRGRGRGFGRGQSYRRFPRPQDSGAMTHDGRRRSQGGRADL